MPDPYNDSDDQLISRFFEGELSAAEEKSVDERIQAEPAFAEKMANFVALHRAAREVRREELESLYPGQPPPGSRLPRQWLWVGLATVVAIALYFILARPVASTAPPAGQPVALQTRQAAHEHAKEQDPDYFDEMGGGWKADYWGGRYAEARQKLNAELDAADKLANQSRFCYYAGLLNLYPEDGPADLGRAIAYLEIARKEKEDAPLYLLIAYVQAGQLENARTLAAGLPAGQLGRLPPEVRQAL